MGCSNSKDMIATVEVVNRTVDNNPNYHGSSKSVHNDSKTEGRSRRRNSNLTPPWPVAEAVLRRELAELESDWAAERTILHKQILRKDEMIWSLVSQTPGAAAAAASDSICNPSESGDSSSLLTNTTTRAFRDSRPKTAYSYTGTADAHGARCNPPPL